MGGQNHQANHGGRKEEKEQEEGEEAGGAGMFVACHYGQRQRESLCLHFPDLSGE